ncbi:MAG: PA14 domain-containing protein [Chthoniobacteraceae bacterium]
MTAGVLEAQSPTPAADDSKSGRLEDRVEKLEGNIGEILQLLKAKQPPASTQPQATPSAAAASNASPVPSVAAAAAQPASAALKPGAILEVWPLKVDFEEPLPQGRSSGGFIDKGNYFQFDNFAADKSFASMKTNHVALRWSGFFRAKEAGSYVFTVELQAPAWYSHKTTWLVTLLIDQQPLVVQRRELANVPNSFSDSAETILEPGYYPLSLVSLFQAAEEKWNYKGVSMSVKARGPSDMIPEPLTPANFLHKE